MGNFFAKNNSDSHLLERIEDLEEQLRESKKNRVPLVTPWRDVGFNVFSEEAKNQLLEKIGAIDPPCDAINLMVVGKLTSGKSSYVNTLKTVLRNSGQLATIQKTYGCNIGSTTKKFCEVTLKKFGERKRLRIYDCRGLHSSTSVSLFHDLQMAISGHIRRNYVFQTNRAINEDNDFYKGNPTINDQMHCIVYVIDVETLDTEDTISIISGMRDKLFDLDIPARLILTKVDNLDLCNAGSLNEIFRSRHAKKKVNAAKEIFDFHECEIWPIANYVKGITQNITQDVLALLSLDNILEEAIAYIENQPES